jgi:nucleoside 2-deoxyribosyltransferase
MNKTRKLFFAIPFDSATRNQYDRVSAQIRNKYPEVTIVTGNEQIGPSQRYSDIATFKAQNRELNVQFVKQISEADIVIADLTHNNPNVHLELGIALEKSKNILRVIGRDVSNIGFDVRNLEATRYWCRSGSAFHRLNEGGSRTMTSARSCPRLCDIA